MGTHHVGETSRKGNKEIVYQRVCMPRAHVWYGRPLCYQLDLILSRNRCVCVCARAQRVNEFEWRSDIYIQHANELAS